MTAAVPRCATCHAILTALDPPARPDSTPLCQECAARVRPLLTATYTALQAELAAYQKAP